MGGAIIVAAAAGALAALENRKSDYPDPSWNTEEEKKRKYDWEMECRKVYSIRTVKRPFGEGIEISRFDPYEQVKCKKGLIARIFPSKETSKGDRDSYMSVIYKYPFENNSENHSLFKELTDRLNEKQGKKINNKLILSNQGLEERLDNGTVIRINKEDKKGFPKEAYQFVDGWGHLVGYPSDVIEFLAGAVTFAAGFAGSIFALIPGYNPISSLVAYLPTTAAGIAMLADNNQSIEWRGGFAEKPGLAHRLGHQIGIKLATINFEERLRKEDYALNKFLSSDETVVGSLYDPYGPRGFTSFKYNQHSQQYHHRNELHEALTKMFEFTPYQKGFSINSKHINRITALRFVEYLLTGKSSIQPEKEDRHFHQNFTSKKFIQDEKEDMHLHQNLTDKESIQDEKEVRRTYHMEAERDTEEMEEKKRAISYLDSRSMVKPYKSLEKAKEAFNEGNFNEIINNLKIMIKKGHPFMWGFDKVYSKMRESELEELAKERYPDKKIKHMKKRLREVKKDPEKYQGFRLWDYTDALELIFNYVPKKIGNSYVLSDNQTMLFTPSVSIIDIKFEDLPFEEMKKYNESHNKEIYTFTWEKRDGIDPKLYGKPVHPFDSTANYFFKIGKPIEALSCIKKSLDEEDGSINIHYENLLELSLNCIDSISSKK